MSQCCNTYFLYLVLRRRVDVMNQVVTSCFGVRQTHHHNGDISLAYSLVGGGGEWKICCVVFYRIYYLKRIYLVITTIWLPWLLVTHIANSHVCLAYFFVGFNLSIEMQERPDDVNWNWTRTGWRCVWRARSFSVVSFSWLSREDTITYLVNVVSYIPVYNI